MLWKVRTTVPDRPGALARLTQACAERDVNVLALDVLPGIEGVTDEMVVATPSDWSAPDVERTVAEGGGCEVTVRRVDATELEDGPTRYLRGVLAAAADPPRAAAVLADLLAAEVWSGQECQEGRDEEVLGCLRLEAASHAVHLHRQWPFTGQERSRAEAIASAAAALPVPYQLSAPTRTFVLGQGTPHLRPVRPEDLLRVARMAQRCSAATLFRRFEELPGQGMEVASRLVTGAGVVAAFGEEIVGMADVTGAGSGTATVGVLVEDAWQRQGVGARLASHAARMAKAAGARHLLLETGRDNLAVVGLLAAAGLTPRLRTAGGRLTVTARLDRLSPLEERGTAVAVEGVTS